MIDPKMFLNGEKPNLNAYYKRIYSSYPSGIANFVRDFDVLYGAGIVSSVGLKLSNCKFADDHKDIDYVAYKGLVISYNCNMYICFNLYEFEEYSLIGYPNAIITMFKHDYITTNEAQDVKVICAEFISDPWVRYSFTHKIYLTNGDGMLILFQTDLGELSWNY